MIDALHRAGHRWLKVLFVLALAGSSTLFFIGSAVPKPPGLLIVIVGGILGVAIEWAYFTVSCDLTESISEGNKGGVAVNLLYTLVGGAASWFLFTNAALQRFAQRLNQMIDWRHESLFNRPPTTYLACRRSWHAPRRGGGPVPGIASYDQTVSQATPGVWEPDPQTDSWPSPHLWSHLGCRIADAVGRSCGCHPGAALPGVGADAWRAPQHRHDEPGDCPPGLDTKKKSLGATERSETARAAWHDLAPHLPPERLLFLDECGSHIALTPLYARAPRGQRAFGTVPRNRGKNTTLIAGLSLTGIQAPLILEGAIDTAAFALYVEHVLAPVLSPGHVVVLDNLSVHTSVRARQAIEARGGQVLFLPAYSPDLTPIEEAFSKLKAFLRRMGARTHEALREALGAGLETITRQDAAGWFGHCGYPARAAPS